MSAVEQVTDERILIEAAQQDPARFAELYQQNFDRVYGFVSRRVRDRDEAEDVTSEVFHQALANLGRFEWRGVPFSAWLFRIASNALADRWQRTSKTVEVPMDGLVEDGLMDEIERNTILVSLVDTLPPDQRYVIARRFVDQQSIRQIAQDLGRSEGAIAQLQFRALKSLRTLARSDHE